MGTVEVEEVGEVGEHSSHNSRSGARGHCRSRDDFGIGADSRDLPMLARSP